MSVEYIRNGTSLFLSVVDCSRVLFPLSSHGNLPISTHENQYPNGSVLYRFQNKRVTEEEEEEDSFVFILRESCLFGSKPKGAKMTFFPWIFSHTHTHTRRTIRQRAKVERTELWKQLVERLWPRGARKLASWCHNRTAC